MGVLLGGCAGGGAGVAPPAPPASASPSTVTSASPSASTAAVPEQTTTGVQAYDATDADLPAGTLPRAGSGSRSPRSWTRSSTSATRATRERSCISGRTRTPRSNGDEGFDAIVLEHVVEPVDQRSVGPPGRRRAPLVRGPSAVHGGRRLTPGPRGRRSTRRPGRLRAVGRGSCGSVHPNLQCVLVGYGPGGDEPFAVFAGSRFRIVVAGHDGTPVLFAYQATDDDRFGARASVFDHWVRSVDFR